jgi:hypothetical protein
MHRKMKSKYLTGYLPNPYIGRGRQGVREDLGHFVRSIWEANLCRIFKYCGIEYEYEKHRFDLDDCVYICDFYFPKFDVYVECKGYLYDDARDKLIKVLEKYPDKYFKLIDAEVYHTLAERYKRNIPNWEEYK